MAWQLAQQREHFELQLERLNGFLSASVAKSSWAKDIRNSLQSERLKIIKQTEAAKKRLEVVKRELDVTTELSKSLKVNCSDFIKNSQKLDSDISKLDSEHRTKISQLQAEIDKTMMELSAEKVCTGSSLGSKKGSVHVKDELNSESSSP